MSASREKQNRQEQVSSGWVDPKTAREAQQRKQEKRSNRLYGVIAVVFVLVAVAAIIYRSNIIPKMSTAATIDGEKYTAAEVSFYYQNAYRNLQGYASYLGLNPSASLKDQTITGDAATMAVALGLGEAKEGETWYDFILDQALKQMAQIQTALGRAAEEGFTYPAGVQAQYDDSMETLKSAAQASSVSVDQYLTNVFGTNLITEKIYGQELMRMLQFDAYANGYVEGLSYDEAALEEAYVADPKSYDKVSYESVSISGAAPSTTDEEGNTVEPTEEESAAAKAEAKAAADKMLADLRAGGDLSALAEANEATSYSENERGSYNGSVLTEWLFDDARKAGDTAVLESGSTYYVAVFHDRTRESYDSIDVRHILVQPSAGTIVSGEEGYEAEQAQLKDDAKAKAEALLEQWKSGEATEDSFAALAMEESTDGSKYVGGLYTRVSQGDMVQAFNDWCFDPARQSGDTGVVETQYGYHVMYFVGTNAPAWQVAVAKTLENEAYGEWVDGLSAESTITRGESGLKYVG